MNFEEMNKDELVKYIKELNEEKNGKYGLIWDKEKEPEQIVVDCDKYIPVLKEYITKNIKSDGRNNLLIEGDNFHSLSVLNYTHKEKIDVIYIDPPYNTGSKDFIYNDKFVDAEDGYRHSKWLNFMQKRLKLAKELLKSEGVLFISIDNNEYAQLKLLCDSIFGEGNNLGTIIQNKGNAQNDATDIQKNHEYILVYRKEKRIKNNNGKNIILSTLVNQKNSEKEVTKDSGGYFYKNGSFTTGSSPTLNERHKMGWTIYYNPETSDLIGKQDYNLDLAKTSNDEKKVYNDDKELLNLGYVIIRAPKKGNKLGRWSWSLEKFNENKQNVVIVKTGDKYSINVKKYVDEKFVINKNNKYYFSEVTEVSSKSIIDYSSAYGTTVLNQIIGTESKFNNPKNIDMIKYLIKLFPNKNAVVLDFFAGSGTTGHAVLDLNREDGGNRQFILCTNNENNICDQITYPRLSNIINGNSNMESLRGSLKYFKTDFVDNVGTRDQLYYDLTEKCIPMLCVKEETFNQVELNEEYAVYTNKEKSKYTFVYFDIFGNKYNDFKEMLEKIDEEKALYIFTLGDYVNTDDLKKVKNYTIEAIPYRILDLYKKVVKMSKED